MASQVGAMKLARKSSMTS